jgi:hypothetical protein
MIKVVSRKNLHVTGATVHGTRAVQHIVKAVKQKVKSKTHGLRTSLKKPNSLFKQSNQKNSHKEKKSILKNFIKLYH